MKLIISLFFVFLSVTCFAQVPQKVNSFYEFKAMWSDTVTGVAQNDASPAYLRPGCIRYDSVNRRYLKWDRDGWTAIDSANQGLSRASQGPISLGQLPNASGNPAKFLSNRYLPMNAHSLTFADTNSTAIGLQTISINDSIHLYPSNIPLQSMYKQKADTNTTQQTFMTWEPNNYGYNYPGGSKGNNQRSAPWTLSMLSGNNNDPGGPPDNVIGFQYNAYNLNQKADSSDGIFGWQMESNFNIFGRGLSFEYHDPVVQDFSGVTHRINSYYITKSNGDALQQSQVNEHTYTDGQTNVAWSDMLFHGGAASFSLIGNERIGGESGNISISDSDGTGWQRSVVGGSLGDIFIGPGSAVGIAAHYNHDGSVILNANDGGVKSQGNTVVGAYNSGDSLGSCFSCQLQVTDSSKGFLISRLNTNMINVLPNATEGLQVYNRSSHVGMTWEPSTSQWVHYGSVGHYIFNPSSGDNVAVVNYAYNIIDPTGALGSLTITLPSGRDLLDNATIEIKLTQTVTSISFSGGTVQGTLQVGYNKLVYDAANNVWF